MANSSDKKQTRGSGPHKVSATTIAMAIGILLILFGLWQLAERFLGHWYSDIWYVISTIINIAWPLVIIAAGIVLMIAARRGNLSFPADRKLYRSIRNKKIGGVCGGIAEYLNVDPAVVRIITIVLAILSWYVVIPLYILFWIIIEPDTKNYSNWV